MKSSNRSKRIRFEFKHITTVFVLLILAQVIISFFHKQTLKDYLLTFEQTNQQAYARQLVDISLTTLEFQVQLIKNRRLADSTFTSFIQREMGKFFNRQSTQYNITETIILLPEQGGLHAIRDSADLFLHLTGQATPETSQNPVPESITRHFIKLEKENPDWHPLSFHYGSNGDLLVFASINLKEFPEGVLFLRTSPLLSEFTREVISSYDESTIIFLSFILLGILAMYYIASYTAVERDEAQELLVKEHEQLVKEQVIHEKENLFTRRIYHTHHKAEKVMGFIKEDLRSMTPETIDKIKERVIRYSNFMSRVIYDMKWYDAPVQTIRNPMFQTDLNELIQFITDNIFNRVSTTSRPFHFQLNLQADFPRLSINEFVLWEIIEPIIQNSIEHGAERHILITITTSWDHQAGNGILSIRDNGKGISDELLEVNENGVKRIFAENVSTKLQSGQTSGYGCFIAWYLSTSGCGWKIDAQNHPEGGCEFVLTIPRT